jgi:xanthine dehydrogenase accessory factor
LISISGKRDNNLMSVLVLILGAGDLASGVALRLYRAGLRVVMTELPQPLSVRRLVSFAEAVYTGEVSIEGVSARRVTDPSDTLRILRILSQSQVPVLVDPEASSVTTLHPAIVVDARMNKLPIQTGKYSAGLVIGLGPGFIAGENCHAVVETNRGHFLGRVLWQGQAEPDTGVPDTVMGKGRERVLRAPADGILTARVDIGDLVKAGSVIANVEGRQVIAPFDGVLRGLIHPGLAVKEGMKIGDLDPRGDQRLCILASDKSLAVGGGVLEAILARRDLRPQLWT